MILTIGKLSYFWGREKLYDLANRPLSGELMEDLGESIYIAFPLTGIVTTLQVSFGARQVYYESYSELVGKQSILFACSWNKMVRFFHGNLANFLDLKFRWTAKLYFTLKQGSMVSNKSTTSFLFLNEPRE